MWCQNCSCMFLHFVTKHALLDRQTDGQTDRLTVLRSQDRACISRGKNRRYIYIEFDLTLERLVVNNQIQLMSEVIMKISTDKTSKFTYSRSVFKDASFWCLSWIWLRLLSSSPGVTHLQQQQQQRLPFMTRLQTNWWTFWHCLIFFTFESCREAYFRYSAFVVYYKTRYMTVYNVIHMLFEWECVV